MRIFASILAAALFATLTQGSAASAHEADRQESNRASESHSRSWGPTAADRSLLRLVKAGASGAKIRRVTGFQEIGLSDRAPHARSESSVISVNTPRYFRWPKRPKLLYVTTGWRVKGVVDLKKNGGVDGFGLRFSKPVVNYGSYLEVCEEWIEDVCRKATNYYENSENGASWQFQDRTWVHGAYPDHRYRMNWDKGTMLLRFKPLKAGCYQAFARYAHSFARAKVTGFGLSTSGFSVAFNRDDGNWMRTSQGGRFRC